MNICEWVVIRNISGIARNISVSGIGIRVKICIFVAAEIFQEYTNIDSGNMNISFRKKYNFSDEHLYCRILKYIKYPMLPFTEI